jgi:hypothetical protein
MSAAEVAGLQAASAKNATAVQTGSFGIDRGGFDVKAALFWAFVGIRSPGVSGRRWKARSRYSDRTTRGPRDELIRPAAPFVFPSNSTTDPND